MPFDNPYFPTQFDIGTPGAGHIHFASDGSMTLYAADGVTKIATLDPANSFQVFNGLNSIQVSPTSGAGNYPGILFNVSPHAHKGEIRAADQAGQGLLHFHSPYDTDFASIDLQSEVVGSNTPSFVGLRAGAASGINVTGTKPAGGVGSHGVISFNVGDDLGATQSITWDGTTLTVPGILHGERIEVTGPASWFNFQDRATGQQFAWYSSGNVARLRNPNAGTDIVTIDTSGTLTTLNLSTDTQYTPAWYDNTGGQPSAFTGAGSFRFGQYQRIGKAVVGDAYITVGSGGGITAGKLSFDLPVSVSGSFPGGMVGVWYTGNGDQGFIKSGYNVTKCDLVHADGSNYAPTPTNGQQFVCRYHYIGN